MIISDHFSESLETVFRVKILLFFDEDLDLMEKVGSGINIQDPQNCR
jgi:hypothetical protein